MRKPTILAAAAWLASCALSTAHARVELPGTLAPVQQFQLVGSGSMSWFGLHLYDVALWSSAARFDPDRPFALALRYTRGFKGARIAERSVAEIERLGLGDAVKRARWGEAMAGVFPNVRAGDKLTGVYRPGRGAEFFYNDVPVGRIDDTEFARAFFGIWLDPRTREPELRKRLIGAR